MSASDPDFAPANPTDGRQSLDWKSKYTDPVARRGIRFEACYLAALFFGAPLLILVLWLDYPKDWLCLTDEKYRILFRYGLAWISGLFGGTIFSIKWLYHVVAKQLLEPRSTAMEGFHSAHFSRSRLRCRGLDFFWASAGV